MRLDKIFIKYFFAVTALFLILFTQTVFAQNDSVSAAAKADYDRVSNLHLALWGENYRKIWATPVKMRVFHISQERGGLRITEEGGGLQTKSLHLEDAQGNKFALRTVQKFPGRALSRAMKNSVVDHILTDEVTTSHPYAALTVPPLAEALNIPHTHPIFVYVPDDPALGKYRKDFANQVCLLEEREPLDGTKVYKTEKVQDKLEEDNDNLADQKMLLRARLLDMVIGDWDRHGDQWRWQKEKDDKETVYEAIPNDRDKVFYTTSGFFPGFLAGRNPQLQPFTGTVKKVEKWNYNARYFDHYFLTSLDESDWKAEIAFVQSKLTDEVIEKAMALLPLPVYKISGPELARTVIERRNNLAAYALSYYKFLAREVNIPATAKNEQITVDEKDNGKVKVTIRKIKKDDSISHKVFERTFVPQETKEIRLYALDGKNKFIVSGTQPSPIKVRMIGGEDKDTYAVSNGLNNKKNLYIYDHPDSKDSLPARSDAKIHLSDDTLDNNFNRSAFKFNHSSPIVTVGYSTETGLRLVGGYVIEKQGFGTEPYASRQELLAGYVIARNSWDFNYWGDFKKAVGDYDLNIALASRGPNNQSNFFGMGNQPQFVNSGSKTYPYYRDRFDLVNADIRLFHTYNNLQVSFGVLGQYYNSYAQANTNKFLLQYNQAHPDEHVFSTKTFSGLIAGTSLDTRSNANYPSDGILWKTTVDGMTGLNVNDNTFGQIRSEFDFYLKPFQDSSFVIADRVAGGYMVGHGSYFQYFALGGYSMRGFHTSRFVGDAIAYNNLELRWRLGDLHWYILPASIGVVGFNDFGRVWLRGENADQWHDSYGGGLFLMPGKTILMATVGISKESTLLYLSIGFRF